MEDTSATSKLQFGFTVMDETDSSWMYIEMLGGIGGAAVVLRCAWIVGRRVLIPWMERKLGLGEFNAPPPAYTNFSTRSDGISAQMRIGEGRMLPSIEGSATRSDALDLTSNIELARAQFDPDKTILKKLEIRFKKLGSRDIVLLINFKNT